MLQQLDRLTILVYILNLILSLKLWVIWFRFNSPNRWLRDCRKFISKSEHFLVLWWEWPGCITQKKKIASMEHESHGGIGWVVLGLEPWWVTNWRNFSSQLYSNKGGVFFFWSWIKVVLNSINCFLITSGYKSTCRYKREQRKALLYRSTLSNLRNDKVAQ